MIKTRTEANTLIAELPAVIDAAFGELFESAGKEWLLQPVELYVLDFKDTIAVKPASYRVLISFVRMAKSGDKRVISLNLRGEIANQFKAEGVLGTFNPVAELPPPTVKSSKLDVTLINPFVTSVVKTLKVQASTDTKPGKPFVVRGADHTYAVPVALTGLIEVHTKSFTGSIALAFPEAVIKKIYENMLGEKCETLSPALHDATGELLNIIYGGAKTQLNEIPGFELDLARPTVRAGARPAAARETVLVLPFTSSAGDFHVEIAWL